MSSAKARLEQVTGQLQELAPPKTNHSKVGVFCTTREHSPGHNVATIVFSNPTKLNVASKQHLDSLIQICEDLGKDDKLRAVVLTGAPPVGKTAAFIGGADVQELNRISSPEEAKTYITRVHRTCDAVRNIPVPVIARVNGFALGAGLELMACCDLRIATKASRFGMPEVKIGLPSIVEAALFPGMIGMGRTKRLIYLAENISANTAEEWGLVERIVDDEAALDRAVDEWVSTIVTMGPKVMRSQKRLISKWENAGNLDEAIQAGIPTMQEAYEDGGIEAKEYIKPFLGRNKQ